MTRKYLLPGAIHFDNMRRTLTKLELAFSEPNALADEMEVSILLASLENSRAFLEGSLYDEFGTRAGQEVDLSQL
jgi:hypothetical protein